MATLSKINAIFLLPLLALLSGCAPGLGKTVRVDYIEPLALRSSVQKKLSQVQIRVSNFTDTRASAEMGGIDGRRLKPQGDVGASVKQAVEEQLRQAGVELSLFAGPVLSGEVGEWQVNVDPGFPLTQVRSQAALRIQVSGPTGTPRYSASYAGSVEQKYPFVTQDHVEKILGEAMAYAIKEAFQDERLISALQPQ